MPIPGFHRRSWASRRLGPLPDLSSPSWDTGMIWLISGLLAAIGLAVLMVFYRRLFCGNFGIVDPGRVYRCARRWVDLPAITSACRPASILNLGHCRDRHPWRIEQMREARRRGIDLHEVSIRYDRRPSQGSLLAILNVFECCRYPLLIHCTDGADRTGLASALYLMAIRGVPPDQAAREAFSPRYGHVPIQGIEHLHEPIREYEEWLKAHGLAHAPSRLKAWLEREYRAPASQNARHEPSPDGSGIG
jgi:hypothetical protein